MRFLGSGVSTQSLIDKTVKTMLLFLLFFYFSVNVFVLGSSVALDMINYSFLYWCASEGVEVVLKVTCPVHL